MLHMQAEVPNNPPDQIRCKPRSTALHSRLAPLASIQSHVLPFLISTEYQSSFEFHFAKPYASTLATHKFLPSVLSIRAPRIMPKAETQAPISNIKACI
jgi:hypothetical protein